MEIEVGLRPPLSFTEGGLMRHPKSTLRRGLNADRACTPGGESGRQASTAGKMPRRPERFGWRGPKSGRPGTLHREPRIPHRPSTFVVAVRSRRPWLHRRLAQSRLSSIFCPQELTGVALSRHRASGRPSRTEGGVIGGYGRLDWETRRELADGLLLLSDLDLLVPLGWLSFRGLELLGLPPSSSSL